MGLSPWPAPSEAPDPPLQDANNSAVANDAMIFTIYKLDEGSSDEGGRLRHVAVG